MPLGGVTWCHLWSGESPCCYTLLGGIVGAGPHSDGVGVVAVFWSGLNLHAFARRIYRFGEWRSGRVCAAGRCNLEAPGCGRLGRCALLGSIVPMYG